MVPTFVSYGTDSLKQAGIAESVHEHFENTFKTWERTSLKEIVKRTKENKRKKDFEDLHNVRYINILFL